MLNYELFVESIRNTLSIIRISEFIYLKIKGNGRKPKTNTEELRDVWEKKDQAESFSINFPV